MKKLNSLNLGKGLSRSEMKNVFGGRGCKLVTQNVNGTYTTSAGECDTTYTTTYDPLRDRYVISSSSFCNTGDGVAHQLSSNGGNSRC